MRQGINKKKNITAKTTNPWRLSNTFLNNKQVTEEIKKILETNDDENTTTQNR